MRHLNFKFPRDAKLNSMLPVYNYKYTLRANLNSNVVLSVPHSRSINSNFKADVLGTQAKLEKMLMAFVISIYYLYAVCRMLLRYNFSNFGHRTAQTLKLKNVRRKTVQM